MKHTRSLQIAEPVNRLSKQVIELFWEFRREVFDIFAVNVLHQNIPGEFIRIKVIVEDPHQVVVLKEMKQLYLSDEVRK